jgi:hypothetical protein
LRLLKSETPHCSDVVGRIVYRSGNMGVAIATIDKLVEKGLLFWTGVKNMARVGIDESIKGALLLWWSLVHWSALP